MAKIALAGNEMLMERDRTVASPNTVHLTVLMLHVISSRTFKQAARGRRGKLLILRLTPSGLRCHRFDTTRSRKISASSASWNACIARGEEGRRGAACGEPPARQERRKAGEDTRPLRAPLPASVPTRQSELTTARRILAARSRVSCSARRSSLPAGGSSIHPRWSKSVA